MSITPNPPPTQNPTPKPKVAKNYLNDIKGKLPLPSLDALLDETKGVKGIVPQAVSDYAAKLSTYEVKGVNEYLCHLDKLPKNTNCDVSKAIADGEKGKKSGFVSLPLKPLTKPKTLLFSSLSSQLAGLASKSAKLPESRHTPSKYQRKNKLNGTVVGQGVSNSPVGTFLTKKIIDDRKGEKGEVFNDAVRGGKGRDVGQRAVLYNRDGSVSLGANGIRDKSVANEKSSSIPSDTINNGSVSEKISQDGKPHRTGNHPNKAKVGATNDLAGGIAALGGISAVVGLLALLMPLHFVTSAITFLTSITTFFTNVNNTVTTYLTVVDALLGIFGIKNSTKTIKKFITDITDNALGKGNLDKIKSAFARGVNTISTTTKLLEKVTSARKNSDNKVDELALSLGTVNNALGEAGLIPPELMATSKGIDDFVDKRGGDVKENLESLTEEIQDKEETTKALAEEQKVRDEKRKKDNKDIADVTSLINVTKTDVSKIDPSKL
jgi:gas vesicle protein